LLSHVYDSLNRLALWPKDDPAAQKAALKKIAANQKKVVKWAKHAPMNYQHYWHLVEAERARVQGQRDVARDQYDKAIVLAQEHGYFHEEGLAHELGGRFYLAAGQSAYARFFFQNALYAYTRWGAAAKVQQLEAR